MMVEIEGTLLQQIKEYLRERRVSNILTIYDTP